MSLVFSPFCNSCRRVPSCYLITGAILIILTILSSDVHCDGYSRQECGSAWAPYIWLDPPHPREHTGYYCKNSGGEEYGCESCMTTLDHLMHYASHEGAWGGLCGLPSTSCGYTSSDCTDAVVCELGYQYFGIYAHCWTDRTEYKCVPDANGGRPISYTVCTLCLPGTAPRGPPSQPLPSTPHRTSIRVSVGGRVSRNW